MNRLNFNQSIGFPLETNILSEMQTAWSILNALGNIAGNFTILQGCSVVGTTVSDGVVFINGEVIEFKGGQVQDNVIIIEEATALEFEDFTEKEVTYTRYAKFGVSTTQYPWGDFKRFKTAAELTQDKAENDTVADLIERIEELESRPVANVPVGLIAIWGQAANLIPEGWEEYTPLSGRIAIGLDENDPDFDAVGASGGSKNKSLTIDELPAHSHSYNELEQVGKSVLSYDAVGDREGASFKAATTGNAGNGEAFDIMNPYRVVLYIQYVG